MNGIGGDGGCGGGGGGGDDGKNEISPYHPEIVTVRDNDIMFSLFAGGILKSPNGIALNLLVE